MSPCEVQHLGYDAAASRWWKTLDKKPAKLVRCGRTERARWCLQPIPTGDVSTEPIDQIDTTVSRAPIVQIEVIKLIGRR